MVVFLPMKVRLVQILCPQRHCIVAVPYEAPDGQPIPEITTILRGEVEALIEKGGMDPWCGLCRSRNWTYEDQPTIFATLAAALPHLMAAEEQQASVREYLRASRS
jgi:hypothetical protein